jgi:eukaryotic-like serine/threonine-protein kinase
MLNAKRFESPKGTLIQLTGVVDENANFDKTLGELPAQVILHCGGVTRMNSVGVKHWITFWEGRVRKGLKLVLMECSPVIVEQLNSVSNFSCGATIVSAQLSFTCDSCGDHFVATHKLEELKPMLDAGEVADRPCAKCGKAATFDDLPMEYLHFVGRQRPGA